MNPDSKIVNLLSCARSEQFEVFPDGEITSKAQKERKDSRKKIASVDVVRKMKRSGKKQCACESGRTVSSIPGDKNEGDVSEKNAARIIITAGDDAKVSLNLILREEIVEEGKEGEAVDEKARVSFKKSQLSEIVAGGDNPPCSRPQCPQLTAAAPAPLQPPPPCGRPVCPQKMAAVSPCARADCPQKTVTPPCHRPACPQVAHLLQQHASNVTYLQSITSGRSQASEMIVEPISTLCYQTSQIESVPVGMGSICPAPSSCAISRRGPSVRSGEEREMSGHYSEASYRSAREHDKSTLGALEGTEMYDVEIAPSVKTVGSTGLSRSAGVVVEADSKESIQSAIAPQTSLQKVKICTATCSRVQSGKHLDVSRNLQQASSQESNLSTEIVEAESAGEMPSKTHVSVRLSGESYQTADDPFKGTASPEKRKSCNKSSCVFRASALNMGTEPKEKSSGTSYKTAGSAAGISRSRSRDSRLTGALSKHSSGTFRKQFDASIKSSGVSYKTGDADNGSQKSYPRKGSFTASDRMGSNRGSGSLQKRESMGTVTSYRSANVIGASESAASRGDNAPEKDSFYQGSERSMRSNVVAQEDRSIHSTRASLGRRSVVSLDARSSMVSEVSRVSRGSYIPEDREPETDEAEETGASGGSRASVAGGGGSRSGGPAGDGDETLDAGGESGRWRLLIFILLLLLMLPFLMLFGAFMALAICRPIPCFHYYFGHSPLGSIFVGKSHETMRAVF